MAVERPTAPPRTPLRMAVLGTEAKLGDWAFLLEWAVDSRPLRASRSIKEETVRKGRNPAASLPLIALLPLGFCLPGGAAEGRTVEGEPTALSQIRIQDAQDVQDENRGPAPYQVFRTEQFIASGAQPIFWVVGVVCDLWRFPSAEGPVSFDFLLKELEVVMGVEKRQRWIVTEGANHLVLSQDPGTRKIESPIGQTYINALLEDRGDDPRRDEWTDTVPVFDDSLVTGVGATNVDVSFRPRELTIEGDEYLLLTFDSAIAVVPVGENTVRVGYDGFVLLDSGRSMIYQGIFRQSGMVSSPEGDSTFEHLTRVSLTDQSDEPLVGVDQHRALEELAEAYDFFGRPDIDDLPPDIQDADPRPEWATGTWLSGSFATAVIGAVSEQTPVPVMSLGGIVLTDQSIQVAGNKYRWDADVEAGRRDETASFEPALGGFPSPLAYAAAAPTIAAAVAAAADAGGEPVEAAGTDDRMVPFILPASAKGTVEVEGKVSPFGGVTPVAALLLVANAGESAIAFATGSGPVPASSLVGMKTTVPIIAAGSPLLFGIGAAAGAIAVDGDGDPPPDGGPVPPEGHLSGPLEGTCGERTSVSGAILFRIRNGVLSGIVKGDEPVRSAQLRGQVDASGNLNARAGMAIFVGTITADGDSLSGSGTWSVPGECSGTWTATGTSD